MRYLLLSRNDWNTSGGVAPAPVQPYPVDAVEEFVNGLLRSNQWRANPEYLLQRTARLIKDIDKVGPLAQVVPAMLTSSGTAASQIGSIEPMNQTNLKPMPVIDLALTCEDCGKAAKSKAGLAAHRRTHQVKV